MASCCISLYLYRYTSKHIARPILQCRIQSDFFTFCHWTGRSRVRNSSGYLTRRGIYKPPLAGSVAIAFVRSETVASISLITYPRDTNGGYEEDDEEEANRERGVPLSLTPREVKGGFSLAETPM